MNTIKTIGIIGGTGKLGSKFAELFKSEGYKVLISGRSTPLTNRELTKKSDVIFICVTIANTTDVIKEITPELTEDKLISDFTSIKAEPVREMMKTKACVIGTHPIFAPHVPFQNQNIAICPERPGNFLPWLKNICEKVGIKTFICTPEEHDKLMGQIQSLTHFLHIAFARTLLDSKADFKKLKKLESPIYRLSFNVFCRILSFDPSLYGQILTENSEGQKILKYALQNATELQKIIEEKDVKKFETFFKETADFLGDFKKEAKEESDFLCEKLNELDNKKYTASLREGAERRRGNLNNFKQEQSEEENKTPSILALGPKLTFSDLQVNYFKNILSEQELKRPKILKKNFSEVIKSLKENPQHLAIVPLENSIQGDVTEVLDEIYRQDFKILAGHWQPIELALCSVKKLDTENYKNITKIFSHPQPLSQSKKFLDENFPNTERVEMTSTAEAIHHVAEQKNENFLAVGPKEAGEFYNLEILAENIERSKNNQTFFALLSNSAQNLLETKNLLSLQPNNRNYETALAFTFDSDKPASLFHILEIFAKEKINLTKIVSRPTGEKRHDYIFYLNFEGKISDNQNLLKNIKSQTKGLKILGEYLVF